MSAKEVIGTLHKEMHLNDSTSIMMVMTSELNGHQTVSF